MRNIHYWTKKFMDRPDAGEAKKYMAEELKHLTSKYEPVVAREAYLRVFNPNTFWSQRFYRKNKENVFVLLPAESAKILLENTVRPPKDPMEPYVAEQAFVKIYGGPIFKKVFERDPQEKFTPMEPLPIPPELEMEEESEAEALSEEELAEVLEKREIARWKGTPCAKEDCKLNADGKGEKPQFCRHHKGE